MADRIELRMKIIAEGEQSLSNLERAVSGIARNLKTASGDAGSFELAIQKGVAAGHSLEKVLRDIARSHDEAGRGSSKLAKETIELAREFDKLDKAADRAAREAEKSFQHLAASVKGGIQDPTKSLTSILENFALGFGTTGLIIGGVALTLGTAAKASYDLAVATGKTAEEQLNLSERTGLNIHELGLFAGASQIAGTNTNALTTAIKTLATGLSENSAEGKRAKRGLEELGVSGRDVAGIIKPTSQLLAEISDALGRVEAPADRARLAVEIFGKGGLELLPLLRGNFKGLLADVERIGVAFDEEGAKKAAAFDDKLDKLRLSFDALKRSFGEKAIGTIEFILKAPRLGGSSIDGSAEGFGKALLNPASIPFAIADLILAGAQKPDAVKATVTDPFAAITAERQQQLQQYNFGRLNTEDRLKSKLDDLASAREAAEKKYLTATTTSDRSARFADIEKIDASITATQRQIQSIKELADADKALLSLRRQIEQQDLNPTAKAIYNFKTGVADAIPARRPQVAELLGPQIGRAVEAEQQAAARKALAEIDKENTFRARQFHQELQKQIREEERTYANLEKVIRAVDQIEKERIDSEVQGLQAAATHQGQLIELLAGPGGEIQALKETLRLRLEAARAEFSKKAERPDLFDVEKERSRLQRENEAAQFDFEKKIAAERRKGLEDYKQSVSRAFDALISGGRNGFQAFIKAQATATLSTIAGNLAGLTYESVRGKFSLPGQGTAENPSTLGKVLQGTPFGAARQAELNETLRKLRTVAESPSGGGGGPVVQPQPTVTQRPVPIPGLSGSIATPPFLPPGRIPSAAAEPQAPAPAQLPVQIAREGEPEKSPLKLAVDLNSTVTRRNTEATLDLNAAVQELAAAKSVSAGPRPGVDEDEELLAKLAEDASTRITRENTEATAGLQEAIQELHGARRTAPKERETLEPRTAGVRSQTEKARQQTDQEISQIRLARTGDLLRTSTDGNTDATDRNTAAIDRLSRSLGSIAARPTGGQSNPVTLPGPPGLTGGAVATPPFIPRSLRGEEIGAGSLASAGLERDRSGLIRRGGAPTRSNVDESEELNSIIEATRPRFSKIAEIASSDLPAGVLAGQTELKQSTEGNTKSTDNNTAAIDRLTQSLKSLATSPSGGGGAFAATALPAIAGLTGLIGGTKQIQETLGTGGRGGGYHRNAAGLLVPDQPGQFTPDFGAGQREIDRETGRSIPGLGGFQSRGPFTTAGGRSSIAGGLFNGSTASTSDRLLSGVATGGAIVGGTLGVISGVKQGGARGALSATSSALGTAALLDPEPISKAVLAIGAAITGLVPALFGDPKKKRAEEIQRDLEDRRHVDAPAINREFDEFGNLTDRNAAGQLRRSNFAAFPVEIEQPRLANDRSGQQIVFPGRVNDPFVDARPSFRQPAPAPVITFQVNAIDAKGFLDHKEAIGNAIQAAMRDGHPMNDEVRRLI